jgi:D-alanyl-lipoteichoic acid acyltransferase DltB (MBOAT superfamily)
MLFNSYIFVLVFLPVTLIVYYSLGRLPSPSAARLWLLAASLTFYGWWSWSYLALLLLTMIFNWALGRLIQIAKQRNVAHSHALLIVGVALNLALLGYFKYATFVAGSLAELVGLEFALEGVVLPLAISFHTFQQIAYIVDVQRGRAKQYALTDYLLFVSFFPQLIAGPIVHHYELMPQFARRVTYRFRESNFVHGVVFFVMGLLKKLIIADPVGQLGAPIFRSAEIDAPGFLEAWLATLAFSVGLYFDFSAYSDMAVGLARMFGIRLPYNFNSPYKAVSIIDFWRRWHMTLSRFLRDYLYIPLGGSRRGPWRRHINLVTTMLLGGLWHGAAWTFVVWGALHGFFLLVNHAWNHFVMRTEAATGSRPRLGAPLAQAVTLLSVMVAWVFFAAPNFNAAFSVLSGMIGINGSARPDIWNLFDVLVFSGISGVREQIGGTLMFHYATAFCALIFGCYLILAMPNSQQFVEGRAEHPDEPQHWDRLRFRPTPASALCVAVMFLLAFALMADVKEFVYFQF